RLFIYPLMATLGSGVAPLSLHDALPISKHKWCVRQVTCGSWQAGSQGFPAKHTFCLRQVTCGSWLASDPPQAAIKKRRQLYQPTDRKSTRLNSSHVKISYAVFCLKKKIK